ncbi:MAG: DUF1289 domain-containing protein [Pseudomonadota bacterium]
MAAKTPGVGDASPCIGVCALDAAGKVCVGCFRTLAEIGAWGTLSPQAKERLNRELGVRAAAAGQKAAGPGEPSGDT